MEELPTKGEEPPSVHRLAWATTDGQRQNRNVHWLSCINHDQIEELDRMEYVEAFEKGKEPLGPIGR